MWSFQRTFLKFLWQPLKKSCCGYFRSNERDRELCRLRTQWPEDKGEVLLLLHGKVGRAMGPMFSKVCSCRMSAHRVMRQCRKFNLDKRIFFALTLFKHEQYPKGGCGYSKWFPEQPGFSPCWAGGPPGLSSNPRYSKNSWKQSLGRICKHHILDIDIYILDGQLLVYIYFYYLNIFYFVWECYKVVTLFPFLFLFLLNDIFLTGWNCVLQEGFSY